MRYDWLCNEHRQLAACSRLMRRSNSRTSSAERKCDRTGSDCKTPKQNVDQSILPRRILLNGVFDRDAVPLVGHRSAGNADVLRFCVDSLLELVSNNLCVFSRSSPK